MDWRKLMGAKPKDEHFNPCPQSPQRNDGQRFSNIADNTDITDRDGKAKNVDKGVVWGFEGRDKPKAELEPPGAIPEEDDFPHADYEASLDWMDPACSGGYPEDQIGDGESLNDHTSENLAACPVGHIGEYKMWRWKKGGPWVCEICHPLHGDKGKAEFSSPRTGK